MKDRQTVIVLDFGGQYKDLIARRVRELGVYSIILSGDTTTKEIISYKPIGIITTGGPKAYINLIHLCVTMNYWNQEYLYWAYAMVCR